MRRDGSGPAGATKTTARTRGAVPRALALLLGSAGLTATLGLGLGAGLGVLPAFAQSFAFSSVRVEGNQYVDAATILAYARIQRGATLSAAEVNDASQRIMGSGLFETVTLTPEGGTLVISVVEHPMINIVNFEGNKRVKDEDLAKVIQSQSRRVYSPAAAEADAATIAELYQAKGRIAATVTPRLIDRGNNRVDLVFEIAEGKVVEIERLSFVGNRAFSDRRLRQVLQTKQAGLLRQLIMRDTFVPERIEVDKKLLTDFYLSRGFIDVQVLDATADVSRERDAYFVTFTLREGRQFRIASTSTLSEVEGVDAAEFAALDSIRAGAVYSPSAIDTTIAKMENLAIRKGLNFVTVEPRLTRNEADGTLDVAFVLTRGPKLFVERIDIEGNTTTLDAVVRRQFRPAEGDPFNPREIRQAAERIRALGYFSDARVDAKPGSAADQVVVNVDVEEQPTGSLSFGVSYGLNAGVGFNLGFSEQNFLGRGQALSLNVATGTTTIDSGISFVEPAFLGRDVRLRFSANYRQTDNTDAFYDTRTISVSPALEFPLGDLTRLELRYRLAQYTLLNVDEDSSDILKAEGDRGPLLSSGLGYQLSYDTRTGGLNPQGGVLLRFGQDFAGLGGDVQAITTTALAVAERRILSDEVTVRAIFEGGAIASLNGQSSRVTERYFGNGKIRGFEPNGIGPRDLAAPNEDALGGNMFAVARFEADFPIGLPEEYGIAGGAFLDVGSVWGLDNDLGGAIDDGAHPRAAAGLSLFWRTPLGPLRFNFSRALVKEDYDRVQNFDLTLSTQF